MSSEQLQGFLPVKVHVPLTEYRRLYAEAMERGMTVADLIMRRAATPKRGGYRPGSGRKSKYMPAIGARIAEARRLSMSGAEVGRKFGISADTAQRYLKRSEDEQHTSTRRAS